MAAGVSTHEQFALNATSSKNEAGLFIIAYELALAVPPFSCGCWFCVVFHKVLNPRMFEPPEFHLQDLAECNPNAWVPADYAEKFHLVKELPLPDGLKDRLVSTLATFVYITCHCAVKESL